MFALPFFLSAPFKLRLSLKERGRPRRSSTIEDYGKLTSGPAEQREKAAEARAAAAENEAKSHALLIRKLKFTIAKLRHAQFGQSAERGAILEQLELQLANLEENASQAQAQAELAAATAAAAASAIRVEGFQRKRPARRPLPDDLPRAGSRLSELTDLERDAVHLGAGAHVRCVGKGRKERCTPLSTLAQRALQSWLKDGAERGSSIVSQRAR